MGAGDAANDVAGIFFMVLSEVLLALVNAIVKFVQSWPTERVMAVRYSLDLVMCLAASVAWGLPRPDLQTSARLGMRGVFYGAFIYCLWAGLRSYLPLGDVVVTVVAVSPLFLVLMTRLFLGEQIPRLWPLQFALCVFGAVLVNKPLAAQLKPAALYPVGAAFFGALMNLMSRKLKDVPPPVVMVFNDAVALLYVLVLALSSTEQSISTLLLPTSFDGNTLLVVSSAVIGWAGLICNVKGYQSVSVAAVASIAGYSSVPLGYLLQVFVFGQVPDMLSVIGAALIISTNVGTSLAKYYAAKVEVEDNKDYKPLPDDSVAAEAQGA